MIHRSGDDLPYRPTAPRRPPLRLKKALGQHFLRDREAAVRIAAAIPQGRLVVEVGPGDGALTHKLLLAGHRVLAIEIDAAMIPRLKRRFHRQKEHFSLIVADVLSVDWGALAGEFGPLVVVGNLPYHIASPLIFRVFDAVRKNSAATVEQMVVTVQREVAERLAATPGGKPYGGLTVLTRYHAEPEFLFAIPAAGFFPKPKVDGGVLRLKFRGPGEFPAIDYSLFRRVVRACFAQRRKVMRNALRVVNDLPDSWQELPFDWSKRPEQFSLDDFVSLVEKLKALGLSDGRSEE